MLLTIACLMSYLAGSVPFAYIAAKTKKIDLSKVGSGNIGATNVYRSVSKPLGIIVFFLDALKGTFATWALPIFMQIQPATTLFWTIQILCAFCAVAGHNWSVFLKFRGGKGVATSAGAVLGIAPVAIAIGFCTWVIVFTITRYVSLGSIIAAVFTVIAGWLFYREESFLIPSMLTLLGALTIWKHRSNIARLIAGTESKILKKSEQTSAPK